MVGTDDKRAAFDAVAHLIAHGHRDIAYVGDYSRVSTSAARLAGYREAMAHYGLPYTTSWFTRTVRRLGPPRPR